MRAIRFLLLDKQTRLESATPIIETESDGSTQMLTTKAANLGAEILCAGFHATGQSRVFLPWLRKLGRRAQLSKFFGGLF